MILLAFLLAWYLFGIEIAGAFMLGAFAHAMLHTCPLRCDPACSPEKWQNATQAYRGWV